jgi:GT2 family glycosyltransferase
MSDHQPVSVVIPTYNGWHLLEKNLPTVIKALRNKDEIIIVDDASTDQTLAQATAAYSLTQSEVPASAFTRWQGVVKNGAQEITIVVIVNKQNLRFGQSVNRGVEQAQHRYLLLLNSDVQPEPDVLTHLLPHFQDSQVFAVGCHEIEVNQDGISGGKNKLWFSRGMFMHSRADEFTAGATAWASGGSSMFDRRKWLELGGFDSAYYPAYWEDVDLSFRARKRGWKVLFEPKAQVYHNHETTNSDVFGQAKIETMSWKHATTFVRKNGTLWQQLLHLLWQPYWWWQRSRS